MGDMAPDLTTQTPTAGDPDCLSKAARDRLEAAFAIAALSQPQGPLHPPRTTGVTDTATGGTPTPTPLTSNGVVTENKMENPPVKSSAVKKKKARTRAKPPANPLQVPKVVRNSKSGNKQNQLGPAAGAQTSLAAMPPTKLAVDTSKKVPEKTTPTANSTTTQGVVLSVPRNSANHLLRAPMQLPQSLPGVTARFPMAAPGTASVTPVVMHGWPNMTDKNRPAHHAALKIPAVHSVPQTVLIPTIQGGVKSHTPMLVHLPPPAQPVHIRSEPQVAPYDLSMKKPGKVAVPVNHEMLDLSQKAATVTSQNNVVKTNSAVVSKVERAKRGIPRRRKNTVGVILQSNQYPVTSTTNAPQATSLVSRDVTNDVSVGVTKNQPRGIASEVDISKLPPKKRKFYVESPEAAGSGSSSTCTTTATTQGQAERIPVAVSQIGQHREVQVQVTASIVDPRQQRQQQQQQQLNSQDVDAASGDSGATGGMRVDPLRNLQMLQECQLALRADEDGDLPLHIAVVQEDLTMVDRLVTMMQFSGKGIDHYNNLRQTPLHLAVITKNPEVVRRLLLGGANPSLPDRRGHSTLHLAITQDALACLQLLLTQAKAPVDPNCKNYEGVSPLHLAVQLARLDLVTAILSRPLVNINITDGKSGRTPLFHAAENNQQAICELLLRNSANPNIQNYSGNTAVHAASGRGYSNIVALLVKHGADAYFKDAMVANTAQVKQALKDSIKNKQDPKTDSSQITKPQPVMVTMPKAGTVLPGIATGSEPVMFHRIPETDRINIHSAGPQTDSVMLTAGPQIHHPMQSPGPQTDIVLRSPGPQTDAVSPSSESIKTEAVIKSPRLLSPSSIPGSPATSNPSPRSAVSPLPMQPGVDEIVADHMDVDTAAPPVEAPSSVLPPVHSPGIDSGKET